MFALVFPHVSFSLENSHKAKDSSQTKTKTRILTIPKVGFLVPDTNLLELTYIPTDQLNAGSVSSRLRQGIRRGIGYFISHLDILATHDAPAQARRGTSRN